MTDLQNPMVVGNATAADGTETRLRSTRTRGLVTQQDHAPYAEDCARGNTWTVSTPTAGITATALMVVSTASAIPIVGLYNPAGNTKNFVIHRAIAVQTTGTVANFAWGAAALPGGQAAASTTAGINNLTFAAGKHTAQVFNGSQAMVGTAPIFRVIGGAVEGATAAGVVETIQEWVEGEIIVQPGNLLGMFALTTTTAGIVKASVTWSEVPV